MGSAEENWRVGDSIDAELELAASMASTARAAAGSMVVP